MYKHCFFTPISLTIYSFSHWQKQETNKFIETVLRMQPRASGGGAGKLSDGIVHDLALRIIDRLQGFRFNLAAQRSKKSASVKQSSKK